MDCEMVLLEGVCSDIRVGAHKGGGGWGVENGRI